MRTLLWGRWVADCIAVTVSGCVAAFTTYFGIPTSSDGAFLQLVVGTTMGAISWFFGSYAYAVKMGYG